MDKLKVKISQYSRWEPINEYIARIETYIESDFSMSLENAKALLETIGKEICNAKGRSLADNSSVNGVLKNAFAVMGYTGNNMVTQISSSLANIGQQVGNLRNDIGASSHGKNLEQLTARNESINDMTKNFLIDSVELVACFLIGTFEGEHVAISSSTDIKYEDCDDFNDYWDGAYGEFTMGSYSFDASEILFNNDLEAYSNEYTAFLQIPPDEDNES